MSHRLVSYYRAEDHLEFIGKTEVVFENSSPRYVSPLYARLPTAENKGNFVYIAKVLFFRQKRDRGETYERQMRDRGETEERQRRDRGKTEARQRRGR